MMQRQRSPALKEALLLEICELATRMCRSSREEAWNYTADDAGENNPRSASRNPIHEIRYSAR